jgi:hypothetical protein
MERGGVTAGDGGGVAAPNARLLLHQTLIRNCANRGSEVQVKENRFVENTVENVVAGNFNLFGHRGLANAEAFIRFTPGATDLTATSDGHTPTALSRILTTNLTDRGGPIQTHALGPVVWRLTQ